MTNAVLAKLSAFVTGTPIESCELFAQEQQRQGARYLRVDRRAARLLEVDIDDATWSDLGVPVGLAFFTTRSRTGEVVATFPGRAGIIESYVPLRTWSDLEHRYPL